jgi:hypothetical protein
VGIIKMDTDGDAVYVMVNGMFWHRIGACGSTCECDSGIASLIKC